MNNSEKRTVSLTPIAAEVAEYVEWLKSKGHEVVKVEHAKLPGMDTRVTFRVAPKTMAEVIAKATVVYDPVVTQMENGDAEVTWPAINSSGIANRLEAIEMAAGLDDGLICPLDNGFCLHIPADVNQAK